MFATCGRSDLLSELLLARLVFRDADWRPRFNAATRAVGSFRASATVGGSERLRFFTAPALAAVVRKHRNAGCRRKTIERGVGELRRAAEDLLGRVRKEIDGVLHATGPARGVESMATRSSTLTFRLDAMLRTRTPRPAIGIAAESN